jgi:hypothetical protein
LPSATIGSATRRGRVEVTITGTTGARAVARAVRAAGGRVGVTYGRLVEAYVPPAGLARVGASAAVERVEAPLRPVQDAVSEGVASTGANAWHAAGYTGQGVKVAVIDSGFKDIDRPLTGDECRTTQSPNAAYGDPHGTAVAELVREMAPGAQLLLYCVNDLPGLGSAATQAERDGAKIIVEALSWPASGRGDGSGGSDTPEGIAAAARRAGVLWVNSAGNFAYEHWSGTFQDYDGDRWLDFTPGDEGNSFSVAPGSTVCAYLKWDDWPYSSQDYDVYLYAGGPGPNEPPRDIGHPELGSSTRDQLPGLNDPPTEQFCTVLPSSVNGVFVAILRRYSTPAPPQRFDLFVTQGVLEYATAAGSVAEPATSPSVLAVGAVCWQGNEVEPYSSRGPTIDGRVKPDLVAPDSVSVDTQGSEFGSFDPALACGRSGFRGTSASAPHVAGAAALVVQRFGYNASNIEAYLEGTSVDLGATGRDNDSGAGKLALPPLSSPPPPSPPPPTPPPPPAQLKVARFLLSPASPTPGHVLVARALVRVASSGAVIRAGRVRCSAALGSRRLPAASAGFRRGYAQCSWVVPRSAHRGSLRGSLTVSYAGATVSRSFRKAIASGPKPRRR